MLYAMIGRPGGGKSYEAVVYHVLPALRKGRKVITNLPLIVEMFAALDESFPDLIEHRNQCAASGSLASMGPLSGSRVSPRNNQLKPACSAPCGTTGQTGATRTAKARCS